MIEPQMQVRYVLPDGSLSVEGIAVFLAMARALAEAQAAIADLTLRVEALEP